MPIFKIENSKLVTIKEIPIDLEKDLQKITENSLEEVLGYKFISSEFSLHNLRVDTLAFDEEANSFVIIEFKRDRSFSVIDQGYAYLSLLLNNKADFILEYNEKINKNLRKDDIDWTQSRVIFLANSFTTYQQSAISFRDLPIELWEVKKFNNNTILYNQLKTPESNESIKTVSKNQDMEDVSREVRKNSIGDHFHDGWDSSRELFDSIREKILNLDSRLIENPNPKYYIGYKIGNLNLVSIQPYKSKLLITLSRTKPEDLKDPEKRAVLRKDCLKHYNQYLSDIEIITENEIDYAMFLIKQVYEKLYK